MTIWNPSRIALAGGVIFSVSVAANSPPTIDSLADITVIGSDEVRVRVVPRDPEGVVPGLRVLDIPHGAMFSDNGDGTRTFRWVPGPVGSGSRRITFEAIDARDSDLTSTRSLNITVIGNDDIGANRAPELESVVDRSLVLGDSFDFRVVANDPEGIVPGLRVDSLPPGASFADNHDGTRQFRWTPSASNVGSRQLTFTAFDSHNVSLSTSKTISLNITENNSVQNPANQAPTFVGLADQQIRLGDTLEFRVHPVDEDGTVPGLSIDRLPVGAAFDDNQDGTRTFRWRPFPIDLGDIYVGFTAIDATNPAYRTTQTVKLTVYRDPNNPVNFPPVINGVRNPTIRMGDTLSQRIKPVDPDFTVPSLSALDLPDDAGFVDNGDGTRTVLWTTDGQDLGDHNFTFLAVDSEDPNLTFKRTITVSVITPESIERSGTSLRELADQRGFLLGYAAVLQASMQPDAQLYRDIAATEFNLVTPENSHKMGWIQPHRGVFEWEDADEVASFAADHGMVLHGHPLVWFAQLPGWVQNLQPVEAQSVMREHIRALVGRYRGRVKIWDVVNEAINDVDGGLRDSIWHKGMGRGYISDAFRTAREADPQAVLIYNDYDVAWKNTKSDAMYELLRRELAAGTPIDGVGFQMHLRSDFKAFDSVVENFQRFADLGLDIYITEFDVAVSSVDELPTQADIYSRSLEICLQQARCRAMQSWGFTDRYSWRSGNLPLMFTDRYVAKPAYRAWQQTLQQ